MALRVRSFFAVLCKTATWNDQISCSLENYFASIFQVKQIGISAKELQKMRSSILKRHFRCRNSCRCLSSLIGSRLSKRHFWTTDCNRKWSVFFVNLSSHYHIYIVYKFNYMVDNLEETLSWHVKRGLPVSARGPKRLHMRRKAWLLWQYCWRTHTGEELIFGLQVDCFIKWL